MTSWTGLTNEIMLCQVYIPHLCSDRRKRLLHSNYDTSYFVGATFSKFCQVSKVLLHDTDGIYQWTNQGRGSQESPGSVKIRPYHSSRGRWDLRCSFPFCLSDDKTHQITNIMVNMVIRAITEVDIENMRVTMDVTFRSISYSSVFLIFLSLNLTLIILIGIIQKL